MIMPTAPGSACEPGTADLAVVRSRTAALVLRGITLLAALTGVLRISGLASGAPVWEAFLFYTVLSNLACAGWFAILIVATAGDLRRCGPRGVTAPMPPVGGAVMLAITVTMAIYLLVLLPAEFAQAGDYEAFSLTDTLVHVATPCLVIADWLLFAPKGRFGWGDPVRWLAVPVAYLVCAYLYGAAGGEFGAGRRYPYPFMNVEALGLAGTAAWLAALGCGVWAIGAVYVAADRRLARAAATRRP